MKGDIVLGYAGGTTGPCLEVEGHYMLEIIVEEEKQQVRVRANEVL